MVRFKLYHIQSLIGYRTSAAGLPASSGDARAVHFKTWQNVHVHNTYIMLFYHFIRKERCSEDNYNKVVLDFHTSIRHTVSPWGNHELVSHAKACRPWLLLQWRFFPSWRRFAMKSLSALLVFVTGIHQTSVNSHHKGLVMRGFDVFFVLAWTSNWTKSRVAGDLRRLTYATLIVLPLCCHYWRIVTKINLYIYIYRWRFGNSYSN